MNDFEKKLIELVEKIKEEPLENQHWIDIYQNWDENYENGIEWGASYQTGEDKDNIFEQHNFFGRTPMEALNKLEEFLKNN